MPKQLINLIGILVSVAVLALGVFLVAMPLVTQALGVNGQAEQVARTNMLYQQQVDALTKAKANKSQTDASVAALRAQIPATPQLDQVFDLVAQASESSGTTITNVTAGAIAPFVARTGATASDQQKAAPTPTPSPSATASGAVGSAQQAAGDANAANQASGGVIGSTAAGGATAGQSRQQIDFAISVTANDMNQVNAFLDALRTGPRLLSNIKSTVLQSGAGFGVQVSALTYIDGATTTIGAK